MLRFLRKHFITGLLAITPLVITVWILWRFYVLVSATMRPWLQRLPALTDAYPDFFLNVIGMVVFLLLIVLAGMFTRNIIGVAFFRMVENFFARIPVVKSVFLATKQIASVFLQDRRTAFKMVVMFEYPRRGMFSLGFVTRDEPDDPLVNVFLPTTPNPTSGFMLMIPRGDVQILRIPVEEAIKLVVSGGAIMTPGQAAEVALRPGPGTAPPTGDEGKEMNP